PTAASASIAPSHSAGRDTRGNRRAAIAEPSARPTMKDATTMAKAYVVGPMINAPRRVQITSYTSAQKPDAAAAAAARPGSAGAGAGPVRALVAVFRAAFDRGGLSAGARSSLVWTQAIVASQRAPAAARRFSATPTHVVARMPSAGMSTNPVAS